MISFGAILGANTRFIIYRKLQKRDINKNLIVLIINTFASFALGFFLSVLWDIKFINSPSQLMLLISVGFLGSLSTFSTFVYDLFDLVLKFKFLTALRLLFISSTLGIIALGLGHLWANQ